MKHFFTRVHMIFFLLLAIFGNGFLKYKIGISNAPMIGLFIVSALHLLLTIKGKRFSFNKEEKKLLHVYVWMIICIFLSLIGFYKIFNLEGILFDNKYIIKQTFYLLFIPIGISIYLCFINDNVYIKNVLTKYSFYIIVLFNILVHFNLCNSTGTYFLLLYLSYIYITKDKEKKAKKLLNILIYILSVVYIKNIFSESTAFLMLMVYTVFLLNKNFAEVLQKKRWIIYLIVISALIFVSFNLKWFIAMLESRDANYWWRFTYWLNELETLKHTLFIGVGYGSTYASTSIFLKLNGGFIDPETGLFVNTANVLFTTAQHNSIMNIFYRMGLIGLILFLDYNLTLLFKSKKYCKDEFSNSLYMLFINAIIIIFFNVGLESPQFLLLYYLSSFGLLSLRRINKELERKEENYNE